MKWGKLRKTWGKKRKKTTLSDWDNLDVETVSDGKL